MSGESGVKSRKAIIKDAQHCKRVAISLQALNTSNVLHDVCFICNKGIKVEAHKLLLCTVSKQLKKMFLELPDNLEKIVIHLPDVNAHILRLICDFLYEGSVKVKKHEYPYFQQVMDLLAIELSRPTNDESTASSTPTQPPQQVQPVAAAAPQYVYFQAPANSQMQYMMAQPIPPGQIVPAPLMTPMAQGAVAQPSAQPMMIAQSSGQMIQPGAQMVTTQVQQMQVVPQNNNTVVPMMGGNQMVAANQMVQCSNQMMVQATPQPMMAGNQQAIINNNQITNGINNQSNYTANQTVQQRPQYVMSNSQQITTSRAPRQMFQRGGANAVQGGTVARGRSVQQTVTNSRLTNLNSGRFNAADIMSVLAEREGNLNSWTAKELRERLEHKLGIDLSRQEEDIDRVLKRVLNMDDGEGAGNGERASAEDGVARVEVPETVFIVCDDPVEESQPETPVVTAPPPKKRSVPFSKSEDETDEDFVPTKTKAVPKRNKATRGKSSKKRSV